MLQYLNRKLLHNKMVQLKRTQTYIPCLTAPVPKQTKKSSWKRDLNVKGPYLLYG